MQHGIVVSSLMQALIHSVISVKHPKSFIWTAIFSLSLNVHSQNSFDLYIAIDENGNPAGGISVGMAEGRGASEDGSFNSNSSEYNGPNLPLFGAGGNQRNWGRGTSTQIESWRSDQERNTRLGIPQGQSAFVAKQLDLAKRNFSAALKKREDIRQALKVNISKHPQAVRALAPFSSQELEKPFKDLSELSKEANTNELINQLAEWQEEIEALKDFPEKNALGEYWSAGLRQSYINSNGILKDFGDTRHILLSKESPSFIDSAKNINQLLLAEKKLERLLSYRNVTNRNGPTASEAVKEYLKNSDYLVAAFTELAKKDLATPEKKAIRELIKQYELLGYSAESGEADLEAIVSQFNEHSKEDIDKVLALAHIGQEKLRVWHDINFGFRGGINSEQVVALSNAVKSLENYIDKNVFNGNIGEFNAEASKVTLGVVKDLLVYTNKNTANLTPEAIWKIQKTTLDTVSTIGPGILKIGVAIRSAPVGATMALWELGTGNDYLSDKKLTPFSRTMAGLSFAHFVGKSWTTFKDAITNPNVARFFEESGNYLLGGDITNEAMGLYTRFGPGENPEPRALDRSTDLLYMQLPKDKWDATSQDDVWDHTKKCWDQKILSKENIIRLSAPIKGPVHHRLQRELDYVNKWYQLSPNGQALIRRVE